MHMSTICWLHISVELTKLSGLLDKIENLVSQLWLIMVSQSRTCCRRNVWSCIFPYLWKAGHSYIPAEGQEGRCVVSVCMHMERSIGRVKLYYFEAGHANITSSTFEPNGLCVCVLICLTLNHFLLNKRPPVTYTT